MLKILQARLQQYMNWELPYVQAGFRKGRETREQIGNICWTIEKARKIQKNIYFCFTMLNLWLCGGISGKETDSQGRNVRDMGSIPGSGRSPGEGNVNIVQYSCLENPIDRRAWWVTVHVLGSFNGLGPGGPELTIRKWKREPEGERERKTDRHGDPSSDGAKVL